MAHTGFDIEVDEASVTLEKFAEKVLNCYIKDYSQSFKDIKITRMLALWLMGKYENSMVDSNALFADAMFKLKEIISIPPESEILNIVGIIKFMCIRGEKEFHIYPRLIKPCWLAPEGEENERGELPELPNNYYIEEQTLLLSVECDGGGGDAQVAFSVYRQDEPDGKYTEIAKNLSGERKARTNTYIAKFEYKRKREKKRESPIKLYFRAYKDNILHEESVVKPFIDGIVAIKTERNIREEYRVFNRKFFEFTDNSTFYGGNQDWYEDGDLFKDCNKWKRYIGRRMSKSGCGAIAATNVIYYYAQQLGDASVRQKISAGLYKTTVNPTQEQYIRTAFRVYRKYAKQTIQGIGFGIWFINPVCNGIIDFAQERGVKLKKHTLTNKLKSRDNSFGQAANFIIEGLKNNYPVILFITFNRYIASKRKIDKFNMAQLHFAVITAIERSTDTVEEDYKLTISNWNNRKTIDSLKGMWEGTPKGFNSFASVSLGYCSLI